MRLDRRNEPLLWRKANGKTDWDKMLEISEAQQRFEWTVASVAVLALAVIALKVFG